eukprot:TRINITY_DN22138_c0_g1_i1.p1 TRINITY_DN22138_c0_g1~~TRINITY_DN22138_c0_g1_i1.p1  ORF type:complete len:366 (-),score=55.23 TRINITY_DN22138_c0_g1_i1:37-1086(-)
MAYGLKKITGLYQANGTGRDWFFVGSYDYRNGRRTPQANVPGLKPTKPPTQPLGPPAEIVAGRQHTQAAATNQAERWAKLHIERGEGHGGPKAHSQTMSLSASEPLLADAAKWTKKALREAGKHRSKGPRGDGCLAKTSWESSSWSHGNIPDWSPKKYELRRSEENAMAGVPRGPCEYDTTAGSGDHTRGLRGSKPHFAATYHDLGQVEVPGQSRRIELEAAATDRQARVPEADKTFKRQEGDHSLGILGQLPHHKSTMSDLGYNQGFIQPEKYAPAKHHHSASRTFFDNPDLKAKKAQEGDECLGIKTGQPHHRPTYSDLGNIPDWQGKRYDFGPIANTRYRFTVWRE